MINGEELVKKAREVVEKILDKKEIEISEEFKRKYSKKQGVFTTILTYPEKELRGCIGFPYPIYPLWKALILSAKAAAFEDPRFPPLRKEELEKVIFEVTVLSEPRKVEYNNPKELLGKIKVGRHGLIVKYHIFQGLLLPQVPVEYGWDAFEFISQTCLKAGLPKDFWLREKVDFFVFEGEIYEEEKPRGRVIKKKII